MWTSTLLADSQALQSHGIVVASDSRFLHYICYGAKEHLSVQCKREFSLNHKTDLKKKSENNIQACTVVTVHLSGRVVSNTTLSLTLTCFRMNFLLKIVRLHIIALSSVAILTLGSHKNQTLPYTCPNISHLRFPSPSLFHDELVNFQFKVLLFTETT